MSNFNVAEVSTTTTTKALAVAASYLLKRSEGCFSPYRKFKTSDPSSTEPGEALKEFFGPLAARLEADGVPAYFLFRYVHHVLGGAPPRETLPERQLAALGMGLLTFNLGNRPLQLRKDDTKFRDEMYRIAESTGIDFDDVREIFKAALTRLIATLCRE